MGDIKPAELSRLTGIGRNSLSGYINGEHTPKTPHLKKIAAALNVPIGYLAGLEHVDAVKAVPVDKITVPYAAKLLGKAERTLRKDLIEGCELGYANKTSTKDGARYRFTIYPKVFKEKVGV